MTDAAFSLATPGKLVLAGEYAVLSPGEPALVAAVWPGLTASWQPGPDARVAAPDLGLPAQALDACAASLPFVHQAWQVVREALGERIPTGLLTVSGALTLDGQKLGLGGSATACVAAVRTWLQAMGEPAPAETVYRLAVVAHHRQQGNGSGIDVAAAAYGGLGCYRSPGPAWFGALRHEAIMTTPLPFPVWEPLRLPESLRLSVGFTGHSAATGPAVAQVLAWAERQPEEWQLFLDASRHAVLTASGGFQAGLPSQIHAGLRMARRMVQGLGETSGLVIETPALATLAECAESLGASGKGSGAGGGDCGLAFTEASQQPVLLERWERLGIRPVPVTLAEATLPLVTA